jgi:hypothetical protein
MSEVNEMIMALYESLQGSFVSFLFTCPGETRHEQGSNGPSNNGGPGPGPHHPAPNHSGLREPGRRGLGRRHGRLLGAPFGASQGSSVGVGHEKPEVDTTVGTHKHRHPFLH